MINKQILKKHPIMGAFLTFNFISESKKAFLDLLAKEKSKKTN